MGLTSCSQTILVIATYICTVSGYTRQGEAFHGWEVLQVSWWLGKESLCIKYSTSRWTDKLVATVHVTEGATDLTAGHNMQLFTYIRMYIAYIHGRRPYEVNSLYI